MDPWVSLFSGGKDSSWTLYRALERDLPVERLVTVHPTGDSFLYHVPATELATLAAESIGIPIVDVRPDDFDVGAEQGPPGVRSEAGGREATGERGDRELEPLEDALFELAGEIGGLGGVTAGAVESSYQTSRIQAMCERLGADLYAPLWQEDPVDLARSMLDAGFEITIVRVAARGLDASWLGRTLDVDALAELEELGDEFGVHVLGEGGEYETLVTDAPHMDRPIELEHEPEFDGVRGTLRIRDAWLGE